MGQIRSIRLPLSFQTRWKTPPWIKKIQKWYDDFLCFFAYDIKKESIQFFTYIDSIDFK